MIFMQRSHEPEPMGSSTLPPDGVNLMPDPDPNQTQYRPLSRPEMRRMTFQMALGSKILTGSRRQRRQKARLASKLMLDQIRTRE